jgi:PAT family beta-lactamase induction signal transducer AmpG
MTAIVTSKRANYQRLFIMFLLGFSSGLPIALVGSTLQAWYTVSGISIVAIGFLGLITYPYAFKFFWAPIMDRFIPPLLGRRRGWMLITQLGLLLSIFIMAWFSPMVHPIKLAILAMLVAFLSASQDISLDAYRADILPAEQRGMGAALWINGYRVAMIVSGALALILAQHLGWHLTYMVMAALMLVGVVTTFLSPEPVHSEPAPQSMGSAIWQPIVEFITRPYAGALIIFIIIYKLGDAFAMSLSSVFYIRYLGFSLQDVGLISKTMGISATLIGALLGGAIMLRWKLYRSLMVFGWLQALGTAIFVVLVLAGKNYTIFAISVFLENLTSGMGTTALMAFLMALCDQRYTATQYALFSAVMTVGRIFVGPIAGIFIEKIGWIHFFLISFVIGVLGLWLLRWLNQRIDFNAAKII